MKRIVSIILTVILLSSTMLLSSCGGLELSGKHRYFGFADPNTSNEYLWFESYSECVEKVESLYTKDSSFYETMLVSYEGDLFDMKYCIAINESKADSEAGPFVSVFDRKTEDVGVLCFAFFEDVSLKDIKYAKVSSFNCYRIIVGMEYAKNNDFDYEGLTVDTLECKEITDDPYFNGTIYEYRLKDSGDLVLRIEPTNSKCGRLSNDAINEIVDSIDVSLYEKMSDSMVDGEFKPTDAPLRQYY